MTFLSDCKTFISDIGFPIFVAVYLLVYLERSMRKLAACLQTLIALQDQHNEDEKLHHQAEALKRCE